MEASSLATAAVVFTAPAGDSSVPVIHLTDINLRLLGVRRDCCRRHPKPIRNSLVLLSYKHLESDPKQRSYRYNPEQKAE
jgi:hypothetical protein